MIKITYELNTENLVLTLRVVETRVSEHRKLRSNVRKVCEFLGVEAPPSETWSFQVSEKDVGGYVLRTKSVVGLREKLRAIDANGGKLPVAV